MNPNAFGSELFGKTIEMYGLYSKVVCYKLCVSILGIKTYNLFKFCYIILYFKIQSYIIRNCGCFDVDFPLLNTTYDSCILKDGTCNTNVVNNADNDENFKKDCEAQCPLECDRFDFDYVISGNEVS